eukprot:COSAG04_NODE_254_length_18809_cov_8.025869_12_plen_161_part_00
MVLKNLLLFLVTLGTALPMHDTLWAFSGRDVRLARAGGVGASGGVMYGELYWMVVTPCNMLCGPPPPPRPDPVPSEADRGCVWRRPGIYSDLLAPYILVRPNRNRANPKPIRLTRAGAGVVWVCRGLGDVVPGERFAPARAGGTLARGRPAAAGDGVFGF